MKQLGNIPLPEQTEWVNRYSTTPVAGQIRFTTGGVPIITEQGMSGGQEVIIEFQEGVEWLDETTVKSIKALEGEVGGIHELKWEGEILRVSFNRQKPSNFTKVMPGTKLYTGQINLVRV